MSFVGAMRTTRQEAWLHPFPTAPDFRRDNTQLETLLTSLPKGPQYAVEFHHDSWFDEQVFRKVARSTKHRNVEKGKTGS
jgi:uncharacterized protein YecE (DUF72 family)